MNKLFKNLKEDIKDLVTLKVFQTDYNKEGMTLETKFNKAKKFLTILLIDDTAIAMRSEIHGSDLQLDDVTVFRGVDKYNPMNWIFLNPDFSKFSDLTHFYVLYCPKNFDMLTLPIEEEKSDIEELEGLTGEDYYKKFLKLFNETPDVILDEFKDKQIEGEKYGVVLSTIFKRALFIGQGGNYINDITKEVTSKGTLLGIYSYPFNLVRALEISNMVEVAPLGCAFLYYDGMLITIGWTSKNPQQIFVRSRDIGREQNSKVLGKQIRGALQDWTKKCNLRNKEDMKKFGIFYQGLDISSLSLIEDSVRETLQNKPIPIHIFPLSQMINPNYNISIEDEYQFLKTLFV